MNRSDGKLEPTTLDFIDALRGFAIMGVIAVHTIEIVPPHSPLLLNLARHRYSGRTTIFRRQRDDAFSIDGREITTRVNTVPQFLYSPFLSYCAAFHLRDSDLSLGQRHGSILLRP